ncbi:hypothetical protein [Tenacibaculum sp. M341]|uniref:hypothetical protein n=1 Tax=Tenacibaculum sp. M341 TaxID=2530339 RepID=UPI0010494005|nr:hypothetical protein [Tenacibaculum sp. M341]
MLQKLRVNKLESLIVILIGFVIIAVFDILGSILSRVLGFEYVWLTFGSFIIYGMLSLYLQKYDGLSIALLGSFLIGLFDGSIGLLIADKLKANIREEDKAVIKITPKLIFSMGVYAAVTGMIAILLFS